MVDERIFQKLAKSKPGSRIKLSKKELKIAGGKDAAGAESYAKRILKKQGAEIKLNFNISGSGAIALIKEDIFQQILQNKKK